MRVFNLAGLAHMGKPGQPPWKLLVPSLTWDRASSLRLDASFHARISGHVYAQPLFWRG